MDGPLASLGLTNPVLAAPMSGGPTTPAMVVAAASVGSFGFLAGGYKPVDQLAAQIAQVRAATPAFGVNLFAPNPVPVDPGEYRLYASSIQGEAGRYGIDLSGVAPREDDDDWEAKVELLLSDPVPVASFTFGLVAEQVVHALRRVGTLVLQSVTSLAEAEMAHAAGVDGLVVQGAEAGGHFGTFTPADPGSGPPLQDLVAAVRRDVQLPVVAAGGLASPGAVAATLRAGADAVAVGTFLLLTEESGASETYRDALAVRRQSTTVVTRAFTGRPARALPNRFTERHGAAAPLGYPALHHLTIPLRRAAAAAGDPEVINLWAGTGHRHAPTGPTADALTFLASAL
ncbi:MAG TPA: nitronate monooxygenase [Acidimicrobiales bacterium]|nr:nitronate monooxygenase [Acidimicrobiales bacterium]